MATDDRSHGVFAVAVTFLTLTWVFVPMRIYTRLALIRNFGYDDALLITTQAIFTAYLSCQLGGWYYGTGRHRSDLTPENNTKALKFWFFCEVFYVLSATFIKLTVGVFLLRISIVRFHVWCLRILMVGSVVFGTSYLFVVLFQCQPISTFWTEAPGTPGKCLENNPVAITTYVASVINCLADWAFGILPMFIVWSLNMKKQMKIIIMGLLGFASIGSTATIVRMFYINDMLNGQDFLWATTSFAIWSTVEPGVGIIAASMAVLRPFFQLVLYKTGLTQSDPLSSRRSPGRNPSDGYIKTNDDQPLSRLRPDAGRHTSLAIAGPKNSTYSQEAILSDDKMARVTKTVEVSSSRRTDDGSSMDSILEPETRAYKNSRV